MFKWDIVEVTVIVCSAVKIVLLENKKKMDLTGQMLVWKPFLSLLPYSSNVTVLKALQNAILYMIKHFFLILWSIKSISAVNCFLMQSPRKMSDQVRCIENVKQLSLSQQGEINRPFKCKMDKKKWLSFKGTFSPVIITAFHTLQDMVVPLQIDRILTTLIFFFTIVTHLSGFNFENILFPNTQQWCIKKGAFKKSICTFIFNWNNY